MNEQLQLSSSPASNFLPLFMHTHHTHTLTHILTHTHPHTPSHTHHTHPHTSSHTHPHTHTFTHPHTHTPSHRNDCSLWWSTSTEAIWCFRFKELASLTKTEHAFTPQRLFSLSSSFTAEESSTGEQQEFTIVYRVLLIAHGRGIVYQ